MVGIEILCQEIWIIIPNQKNFSFWKKPNIGLQIALKGKTVHKLTPKFNSLPGVGMGQRLQSNFSKIRIKLKNYWIINFLQEMLGQGAVSQPAKLLC